MGRRKKEKSLQIEEKEVFMTESEVLEHPARKYIEDNLSLVEPEKELNAVQIELDLARLDLEKTKLEIEQKKHELNLMKVTPSREISPQELDLKEKQVSMSHEKTTLKDKIDKQQAFDSIMVTGRFINRRAPGQPVKLPYIKYITDPVKWYPFEDGKVYTIPRGFADQLNGGSPDDPCYYTPKFIQKAGEMNPDAPQSAIHSVDTSNTKYSFVPINF
jgi:hypothetical protein